MRFITIVFFLLNINFANASTCKLMTEHQTVRHRANSIEECLSIAEKFLGTEDTYFVRYGSPYGGYDEIELPYVVSRITYIYRERGFKTRGRISF